MIRKMIIGVGLALAAGRPDGGATEPDDARRLVDDVRARSAELRMKRLHADVAVESLWPHGVWGDMMWALSALALNERVDEANTRILRHADTPAPFAYFGLVDYVRILSMFHGRSPHHPGRLTPEAESAMKKNLFEWVCGRLPVGDSWSGGKSRIAAAAPEAVGWKYASENHDLIHKANYYLIFDVLRRDPEYQRRALDDGHTVEEHFAAWNDYFRFWLKTFATHGLWVELGSDTYRKYSYSTLLNLYDLAPDPEVRKLAGMFLDLALIEESQMTFADGFRGGGRSRVSYSASLAKGSSSGDLGRSGFESILSLFFGDDKGGATHSRVFETSAYPAPDVAILLRFRGPRDYPLMIRNRVPGELAETPSSDGATYALNFDSGLVNLCFRSPYYMLGSTLQDPRASYSAISSQNRWSGMVFDDRARSRIIPHPEPTRPGSTRTHDAYWSVQHRNVMIVQKTKKAKYMRAMRVFVSPGLERVERDGRVFVSDGRAHAMIVPAIGGFRWDTRAEWTAKGRLGDPVSAMMILDDAYAPVMIHAGDVDDHGSFADFQVLAAGTRIRRENEAVVVEAAGLPPIVFFTNYRLPLIDGIEPDVRPSLVYDSPYLKARFGSRTVTAQWGEIRVVYDFDAVQIMR